MPLWRSIVGKLWMTIIGLVAVVLCVVGIFLLSYIDEHYEYGYAFKKLFAISGVIGFLLTTVFAFFLFSRITRPLQQLRQAADHIILGNYGMRVKLRSKDEIGELAYTFNHMAEDLEKLIKDLSQEKEQLSSILRSMTDAVITFDAEGKVILSNPPGEKVLQSWKGISWSDSKVTAETAPDNLIPEPLQALFESVVDNNQEISSKMNVHNNVWSVVMAPLYAKDQVRGAVAVLRNVTEEHKLDKLRKDFVANVSHELRTPLSMLQGYSEALLDDIAGTPEERKELAQVIYDESLRMGRLVGDLLDLARMEAGHLVLNYARVDVHALLQRVHRKFYTLSKEQGIRLIYSHRDEEKLVLNSGDEDRLEQVLTNLLDNAIRHTPEGQAIYIRAALVGSDETESAIAIEIEDEGQGIPHEDLPFIFERFYKADKARTRTTGGTGLGLAIVKSIIDAHHATVVARSEQGKGTTFTITIPCAKTM